MRRFRWIAGLALASLLLARPGAAVAGARDAMAQWYRAVAPSLFPFMALMPLLTCGEAMRVYEAALGWFTRAVLRLPGAAASAWVVGMLAGSPAGCVAARRAASQSGLSRGQLECLGAACCGLSPGFLINGVGASMLGNPGHGLLLLRTQLIVQALLLLAARGAASGEPIGEISSDEEASSMVGAVLAILTVCGYMTLFGAISRALASLAGDTVGGALLCVTDVTSGAEVVSDMDVPDVVKLPLLSGVVGWGGACVAAQNLAALRGSGARTTVLLAYKIAAALLGAMITAIQLKLNIADIDLSSLKPLPVAALCACALAVPTLVLLKKKISFNIGSKAQNR